VPWATDDLAFTAVFVPAGSCGFHEPDQSTFAKASALMRTAIEHAKELTVQIEDRDRAALDGEELTLPGRDIARRCDNVTAHVFAP
jgi:hypothetical protein